MNIDVYAQRRQRVRERLAEKGLDALLVSFAANRYYLSGFELHDPQCNESCGMLVITKSGKDWLLTDSRYADAALRLFDEDSIFIYAPPRNESVGAFLKTEISGVLGFEASSFSYQFHKELGAIRDLVPTQGIVEELRYIKDAAEIDAMRRSCALNHKVYEQLAPKLVPGVSEKELAWEVEMLFRSQGASGLSFDTIAAVGPNAALPHAIPGDDLITGNCPVLVDMGCRLDDYCSDQTRTFWVGDTPTDAFKRTLEQVQTAQAKAIEIIRPGVPINEAYAVSRMSFEEQGVADYFTHALGHGIGLETHEPPSLAPRTEGVFKPGMIVTVEPGLYYPEWGGIRWEYMVLVTEDGCETL